MTKYKFIVIFTAILAVFLGNILITRAEESAITDALVQIPTQIDKPTILPDSPFYFIKRLGEGVANLFTFGKGNQAKRALKLSKIRLAESKSLIEKNRTDLAEKVNKEYQDQLQKALSLAQEIKQEEGRAPEAEKIVQDVSQVALNNQVVILQMIEKTPEESKIKAQESLQTSIKMRTRAIQELSPIKRLEDESQNSATTEIIRFKLEELKKEGFVVSEDDDTDDDTDEKEITLNGKLVDGGIECPRFESNDGDFYTLIGLDKDQFKIGDHVLIKGEIQSVSFCQQDTTVKIIRMKNLGEKDACKESSDCGKPLTCPNGKEYPLWNCKDGDCSQITYFKDPCSVVSSSTPFIKEISPQKGVVGSRVVISGDGFSATENIVMFSSGAIPNIESRDGKTLVFLVPKYLTPLCSYQKIPCLMAYRKITPGKYEVSVRIGNSVSDSNSGISNSVIFEVIDQEPPIECKEASDCGKPLTCPNGKEYPAWTCDEGKCNQIRYFRDPCGSLPLPLPLEKIEKGITD